MTRETLSHRAATGADHFDEIGFSLPVAARGTVDAATGIAVVEHHGAAGGDVLESHSHHQQSASFLVATGPPARFEALIGDTAIDRLFWRHDALFIPAGLEVACRVPASATSLVVSLPLAEVERLMPMAAGTLEQPIVFPARTRLYQKLLMLRDEIVRPGFAGDMISAGLARAALAALRPATEPVPEPEGLADRRMPDVIDYIDANLEHRLSLDQLAAVAGLSPFHLTRVFTRAVGTAPYRFIMSRRIARARQQLEDSDRAIAALALDCGFSSQAHFTAAFTKAVGTPPSRYRRTARGGLPAAPDGKKPKGAGPRGA